MLKLYVKQIFLALADSYIKKITLFKPKFKVNFLNDDFYIEENILSWNFKVYKKMKL